MYLRLVIIGIIYTFSFFGCIEGNLFEKPPENYPNRGVYSPVQQKENITPFQISGNYWALIIAIDNYQNVEPKLKTCVRGAKDLKDILINKYGFKKGNIIELYNGNATRKNIIKKIEELQNPAIVQTNDMVLIFYSGHGELRYRGMSSFDAISTQQMEELKKFGSGYLIPFDAVSSSIDTYIPNSQFRDLIKQINALHLLVISDSCFSVSLLEKEQTPNFRSNNLNEIYKSKSRLLLSSGLLQPVPDGSIVQDCSGHSTFTCYLLKYLKESKSSLRISELYHTLSIPVSNNSNQTPHLNCFRDMGHEYGEFIFYAINETTSTTSSSSTSTSSTILTTISSTSTTTSTTSTSTSLSTSSEETTSVEQKLKIILSKPNSLGMVFAYIPPGEFMMGSPETEKGRDNDETLHKVTLNKGFWMQTQEITIGQWRTFIKKTRYKTEAEKGDGSWIWSDSTLKYEKKKGYYWDNPGFPKDDNHPVTCVSWNDVQKFITWLNKKENKEYRLPTEAEWEYAARAETTTPFAFGECLSTDDANYNGNYPLEDCPKGNYRKKTIAVGSFKANAWGLYDMHGNIWEWCQDKADWNDKDKLVVTTTYQNGVINPVGDKGSRRVFRGGSWNGNAEDCRSANRGRDLPGDRLNSLGFRLAASPRRSLKGR
ncbi:MAG: SUMF1/EgtB/PvdO family nonheme iron enzyme [Desulfobacterales bacterium]|nr:SUMF1/EgtB/PvdO family nonheme iron enzyme [Desulfobacterales bacterium]